MTEEKEEHEAAQFPGVFQGKIFDLIHLCLDASEFQCVCVCVHVWKAS